MKIIDQSWEWVILPILPLETIEFAGRTCYKSECKITPDSAEKFVKMLIKRGHESVLEHVSASVRFVTNRGVSHELVRHRIASYSQESTRYVDHKTKMEFIRPVWWNDSGEQAQTAFEHALEDSEERYHSLRKHGWHPEQAREVLPNALKTEIVVTANLREWRHIFKLRTSSKAHPQMRSLMLSCLDGFKKEIPVIFDDINV